jgi:hypothetical protein
MPEASTRAEPGSTLPIDAAFTGAPSEVTAGLRAAVRVVDPDRRPDVLIVDRPAGGDEAGLRDAVARARAAGARIVGIRRDGEDPVWAGLADVETGAVGSEPGLTTAPAVDVSTFNPLTFAQAGVAGFVATVSAGYRPERLEEAHAMLAEATRFDPVFLRGDLERTKLRLPDGVVAAGDMEGEPGDALLEVIQKRLGVLDHPSFHASELERAGWIAKLCAAGVPVAAAEISDSLAELLGDELAGLLEGVRARDLADLDLRERTSVALRRAALRLHSSEARWRQLCAALGIPLPGRPMVSVVLATRRESWLEHGIAQVVRQTYEPRELIVCLHGDEFAPGTSERVRSLYERAGGAGECRALRVDGELTLGDALNAGVEAARGELVTKMDDDDYYSTEHLWDLVLALEYSGADLVGKAAEFVYLEEIDVTVRQISQDVDTRMAGGGMMARRAPLRAIGGWPQRSRGEDLHLIRRFAADGRPIHRIPPHGYILNRHGVDHTWRPQVDYFLFRSERQWRGLGFDVTAIEPPTDPYSRIP